MHFPDVFINFGWQEIPDIFPFFYRSANKAGRDPRRSGHRHGTAAPYRVCRRTSNVLGPDQTMEKMAVRKPPHAGLLQSLQAIL